MSFSPRTKWKVGCGTSSLGLSQFYNDDGCPYLWHVEVVTDLRAEFNTITLHRLDHSKETEIDHKSRVQVLSNISVREGVTMDLFTILI